MLPVLLSAGVLICGSISPLLLPLKVLTSIFKPVSICVGWIGLRVLTSELNSVKDFVHILQEGEALRIMGWELLGVNPIGY